MPWITQINLEDATGLLRQEYQKAIARSGRIWNIVRIMSLNPRVMKASMEHYGALMHGDSPLSRVQREMLATVVAVRVGCVY